MRASRHPQGLTLWGFRVRPCGQSPSKLIASCVDLTRNFSHRPFVPEATLDCGHFRQAPAILPFVLRRFPEGGFHSPGMYRTVPGVTCAGLCGAMCGRSSKHASSRKLHILEKETHQTVEVLCQSRSAPRILEALQQDNVPSQKAGDLAEVGFGQSTTETRGRPLPQPQCCNTDPNLRTLRHWGKNKGSDISSVREQLHMRNAYQPTQHNEPRG